MKRMILSSGAALLFAACATTDPDRVSSSESGVRDYELQEQPQANVTGSGTLMRGAYDETTPPTGAFTGKETVHGEIGQFPTPPRESTAGRRVHEPAASAPGVVLGSETGSGIIPPREGTGAGTLGQAGIQPGRPVSTATIMTEPAQPGTIVPGTAGVNPPDPATAPTLSEPLTRNAGSAPAEETGRAAETLDLPPAVQPEGITSLDPDRTATGETPLDELTLRVREVLSSGRPGTITHLTPDRLENLEIDAQNGVVTLRGDVRSETEKMMLGNKVRSIHGVVSLNNQLRVVSPTRGLPDATSPEERLYPLYPEK